MKKTAIIIEDDFIMSHGIKSFLKTIEVETVSIHDEPQSAIRDIIKRRPSMILVDLSLKWGVSGLQILTDENIRKMNLIKIVLTGNENRDIIKQCLEAGANGYCLKGHSTNFDKIEAMIKATSNEIIALDQKIMDNEPNQSRLLNDIHTKVDLNSEQIEILQKISEGKRNHEIAQELFVCETTMKERIKNVFRAIGIRPGQCARPMASSYYTRHYEKNNIFF